MHAKENPRPRRRTWSPGCWSASPRGAWACSPAGRRTCGGTAGSTAWTGRRWRRAACSRRACRATTPPSASRSCRRAPAAPRGLRAPGAGRPSARGALLASLRCLRAHVWLTAACAAGQREKAEARTQRDRRGAAGVRDGVCGLLACRAGVLWRLAAAPGHRWSYSHSYCEDTERQHPRQLARC